jgi:gliding motility-associated lipoprotein GldB
MRKNLLLIFIVAMSVSVACTTETDTIDTSGISLEVNITRLEMDFFQLNSEEDILNFLVTHENVATQFLGYTTDDIVLIEQLYTMRYDPAIAELYAETQRVFDDMAEFESQLEEAFKRIKVLYPDFEAPKVYTMITGMGSDLLVTDSLVVIGLDFFLGEDAKFRPMDVPNYILQRYQKEYIIPAIITLISDRFNNLDLSENTMLSEMISYGKAYYFTKLILPQLPDENIIAYTNEQVADIKQNETVIWAHFIDNQLLFESSHFVKNKYMGERPFVAEIGRRCPGRIGAWLGWKIVNAYMVKNKDISIQKLMETENSEAIFSNSGYRPGKF